MPACTTGILQQGLVWDTATRTRISPSGSSGSYPRMIQLIDGSLLAAYASRGNVVTVTSNDEGKTWSPPMVAAALRNEVNMDTPELLQAHDGAVFLCYATRPQGALRGKPDWTKHFEIRIQQSTDNGTHWQDEKVLYAAGSSFKDGCWEPSLLQLPSGELQLFFSDEGIYTSSDEQNISMLRSFDNGRTWTTAPQIIAFRPRGRDGMPVPLWLPKEKKVVVAIEDPGYKNFKPYIIRSSTSGEWKNVIGGDDAERWYALQKPMADSVYAGAPYLRRLSTGETILSYQSTEGRDINKDNNAVMRVAVGDNGARHFGPVSMPFVIAEGYHALWNSLCVLKDDTVIAVTSANGYSKRMSEIWMIKGYLKKG